MDIFCISYFFLHTAAVEFLWRYIGSIFPLGGWREGIQMRICSDSLIIDAYFFCVLCCQDEPVHPFHNTGNYICSVILIFVKDVSRWTENGRECYNLVCVVCVYGIGPCLPRFVQTCLHALLLWLTAYVAVARAAVKTHSSVLSRKVSHPTITCCCVN